MTLADHPGAPGPESLTTYGIALKGLTSPPEGGFDTATADRMLADAVRKAVIAACDIAGSQIPQISFQHIQALDAVRETALTAWKS